MKSVLFIVIIAQFGIFFGESRAQSVEVVVLGIAQDAGYPQAGCENQCCQSSQASKIGAQRVASLGLNIENEFYLIDATPDLTSQLGTMRQYFPEAHLKGIFLTHAHIGHYTGLMYLGREAMATQNLPVYAMPRMKAFLTANGPWDQLVKSNNISLTAMTEGSPVQLGKVRITPFAVPHRDEYSETVGYLITADKTLLYIPDIDKWDRWDSSLSSMLANVDYAFIDATFFDNGELPNRDMREIPHPFVVETIAALSGLSAEEKAKVHFIHLNHTNPLLNTSSEASKRVEKEGMHVARDGERIAL